VKRRIAFKVDGAESFNTNGGLECGVRQIYSLIALGRTAWTGSFAYPAKAILKCSTR
jgi:hypothetical protein